MNPVTKIISGFCVLMVACMFLVASACWSLHLPPPTYGCFGGPDLMQKYLFEPIRANAPLVAIASGAGLLVVLARSVASVLTVARKRATK